MNLLLDTHAFLWFVLTKPLGELLPVLLADSGIDLLPIEIADVTRVAVLPFHHRDPFDRLLAAQALERGLTLVSIDAAFDAYGVARLW
jgi:PIN domain nuclease of toxin-antitoxin system